jgi:hypothetical protein
VLRRAFLWSAAGFVTIWTLAAQTCQVIAPGMTACRAQVNVPRLVAANNTQQCPECCWASISMIFGFYGHPIDQKEIVPQAYGQYAWLPGGTSAIACALSKTWIDANGVTFTSRVVAAFDPANGINVINNAIIVNELQDDHPLLYCNAHHAMLNDSVAYSTWA